MTNDQQHVTQKDFRQLQERVESIVRELHGVESSADDGQRDGGLIPKTDKILDLLENGGIKRKYGKTDAIVAASVIAASGTVIVAVVRSILT